MQRFQTRHEGSHESSSQESRLYTIRNIVIETFGSPIMSTLSRFVFGELSRNLIELHTVSELCECFFFFGMLLAL